MEQPLKKAWNDMIHKTLVLPLLFLMGAIVMAGETQQKDLFDFTGADAAKQWQTVNDGVMGGVSEGKFKITAGWHRFLNLCEQSE
jgi:hypothetical protein